MAELPLGVALQEFWKVNSVSSYAQNYGQYHEDTSADRYKNLAQHASSSVLKPEVRDMLERWLAANAVDEFTTRIITTLRELYTAAKNEEFPSSTQEVSYHWQQPNENLKAPRFDKLIQRHRYQRQEAAAS